MKYLAILVFIVSNVALAQSIDLVDLQQPPGGPVQPGTSGLEVLQFRVYKNTGSAASTMTQAKFSVAGSTADWDTIYLYYDADSSRTVNTGDQIIGSATVSSAGKVTFSGLSQPIPDGFYNGRDYLGVVDIASGANPGNTLDLTIDAPDISVTAGTVSAPFGAISGNLHTIRIDTGTEMDVFRNSSAVPSSTSVVQGVGYIPTSGGNLTFDITNNGTAQLQLTGSTLVTFALFVNCAASVTSNPATGINQGVTSSFTINVDPVSAAAFSFRISIENSDFDENPYIINCAGTAAPVPLMSVSYNSNPVANNGSINVGSNPAAVAVAMTFTITNSGAAALNLTGSPKVQFPILNNASCTTTNAPGSPVSQGSGTTTFTIEFTPVGGGNFNFAVQLLNDDSSHNPYTIGVSGSAPAVTGTEIRVYRQPAGADATVAFTVQPIVAVTNSAGAVDTSSNGTVIEAVIKSGTGMSGAGLGGTTTATVSNGYATFANLSINTEGTGYRLTFTALSSSFGTVDSTSFDVGPPPTSLPPPNTDKGGDSGGCSTGVPGEPWMLLSAALAALCLSLRALRRTFKIS